jgi:uncharacterized SAM-binding protein YcdF (DUF218 family)
MVIEFIKQQLHLSSPLSLCALLAIGVVWLWRRRASRAPRLYVTGLLLAYWFVATPVGANLLVGGLSGGLTRINARDDGRGADAVVVLGGGAYTAAVGDEVAGTLPMGSLLRALEGARVFKLIGARVLIASGGIPRPDLLLRPESDMLRDVLMKAGIAPGAIVEESRSKNTREQALLVGPLLRAAAVKRFVLVTSPTHMKRSMAVFRASGFEPIASVAPTRSEHLGGQPWLLPNDQSLSVSNDALYNYAAWAYYWVRGWTGPLHN